MNKQDHIDDHELKHDHEHGHDHGQDHDHIHDHEHDHVHDHEHDHDHIHDHDHSHAHSHTHTHTHDPEEQKRNIRRVARAIGHLEHVKRMMENNEDCSDVLMQISAVKSALDGLGKSIIKEHMSHCIVDAIESGDTEAVEEFRKAMEKYL